MIKKNYNILPTLNGEVINFITNTSSQIYKNSMLVSDFPIGDFSRYIDTIYAGFYIYNKKCTFVGVPYFIENSYTVVTSDLGDCIKFDSSNKTRVSINSPGVYNTITAVLELTNSYNYLFFVWDDRWDLLYKTDVSTPGQVWSGNIPNGYYVLYIDTASPPVTTVEYGGTESDTYTESLVVFYAGGNTTISLSGSGDRTVYLKALGAGDTLVKTTSDGLYIYSDKTKLGPFKLPINTPCVLDFEYFIIGSDTDIYIYCNYFLIGSGKLIDFGLNQNRPINFNMTSVNVSNTLLSAEIYSLGLFVSSKACPASVYDICCRSINLPVSKVEIHDDDNVYIYKTEYSVWILDYYNDTLMVLYGDELRKSMLSSLYNNLMYAHNNYITVSYGFSLDTYRIVDIIYNNGIFILLLEDRLVIIDKFGIILRYIYCKNISKLFYIENYVLFYDKTRALLYKIYSNDFKNFELPSTLMDIDFGTRFKVCQWSGPFAVVNGDYVSVVKEQSVFGYRNLYDYFDIRTYTVGASTKSNFIFEYDIVQSATKFTGINTALGYRTFANNPLEGGLTSFTIFISIKPMSIEFKRYLLKIPEVLDVYMVEGRLKVELKCVNTNTEVECFRLFNINVWYDIYITYHSSTGLYVYVNGVEFGKVEFDYDTGGSLGQKYIIVGGYSSDIYAAYKFKGFIRDNLFISRSFVNKETILELNNNNVRDPGTFSKYNTYVDAYGVTNVIYKDGFMFVGTYSGVYVYETTTFKLVKSFAKGNVVLDMKLIGNVLSANLVRLSLEGSISGSSGDVIKINGELYGKIFLAGNKVCNSCVYNGNTYVELLGSEASVVNVFDYFGNDTIYGYCNLGKFSKDALNTDIQLVGEFGYDEQSDVIVGDTYTNSIINDKALNCCGEEWGGAAAYGIDIYTSAILCPNMVKDNYDIFLDIKYQNESLVNINMFGIVIDLRYVLLSQTPYEYIYTFIISRHGTMQFPYEPVNVNIAEALADFLDISPCRLYHSENSLLGLSRIKFNFEVSENNLKLLKAKQIKTLTNQIESSSRFAYDFRGGLGNGVRHRIEDDVTFGSLDGSAYFINNGFDDTPVWDLSAEFILRIDSYKEFNPIFFKSTKSKVSYGLALYGRDLKFVFGQDGVISVVDLNMDINLNQWSFVAVYVSDVYIDIFVNGNYLKVPFYGIIDVVESELYVGFGVSLNSRVSNFVGDMLYFDINKSGTLSSINTDYAMYTGSKSATSSYEEVINLDKYYSISDNTFRMASGFYSDPSHPLSRVFRLYDLYIIGYDSVGEVIPAEADSVFSSPLSRRILQINTDTLDYTLHSFSDCSDFSYDEIGGLYGVTNDNKIKYSVEDILNIDKLKYITTMKYSNKFTLFGTLGGIVKVNNILTNNLTKQYWLLDNGVNSLLITDEYVYIAYGEELGFVQTEYIETNLDLIITRKLMPIYTADAVIKSVVECDSKMYVLSNEKVINIKDATDVYSCGAANSLFEYKNDILIVYDNYIRKLSDKEIMITVPGKITDVSYGDKLVVGTSSGFYVFDEGSNEFIFNSVGIKGLLKDFEPVSDYCYHVYINNNNVIYIYRDVVGIKLVEFNLDNKTIINELVLSNLVDGSFSNADPVVFNSIGN